MIEKAQSRWRQDFLNQNARDQELLTLLALTCGAADYVYHLQKTYLNLKETNGGNRADFPAYPFSINSILPQGVHHTEMCIRTFKCNVGFGFGNTFSHFDQISVRFYEIFDTQEK